MNNKLPVVLFVLPIGLISVFAKSALAAEGSVQPKANQAAIVVAQRYDDRDYRDRRYDDQNRDQRDRDQREQLRREQLRREQLRREQLRREELRRDRDYHNESRRVWVPTHWQPGFLGIGGHTVEGHWEYQN